MRMLGGSTKRQWSASGLKIVEVRRSQSHRERDTSVSHIGHLVELLSESLTLSGFGGGRAVARSAKTDQARVGFHAV